MRWRDDRRRLARWGLAGIATLVGLGIAFTILVLYPVPLFPHRQDFGEFSVYSDEPIAGDLADVMADAARRVRISQLHQTGQRFRVYLSNSRRTYAFFCALARRSPETQALVFTRTRSMIVSLEGVQAVRQRSRGQPRGTRLEGSLAFAVAHEVAHLQAAAALRSSGAAPLPDWLSEGWADTVAAAAPPDDGKRLAELARVVLDDAIWRSPRHPADRRHVRWHLLVDFLVTVRASSFERLADGRVEEKQAMSDLKNWLASRRESPGDFPPQRW